MSMISVLLADDQSLVRSGLRMLIDSADDMTTVGEVDNGRDAVAAVRAGKIDVVLMDIRMPELDGIAATEAIVRDHPQTKVLVLTTFDLDEYAFGAIRAGASGFLLKDAQRHEMISAVRAVHRGDAALSPRVTRALMEHVTPRLGATSSAAPAAEESTALESLTDRERDMFLAIGRGLTNAEIAQTLYVGESTVKTHVGRVLAKLGARDRIHAVILAHRHGLVGDERG